MTVEIDGLVFHTIADALAAPPRTKEEEEEYRRGYCDGFIAAVNLLPDIQFLRSPDRIAEALYDHWEHALSDWRRGKGEWLPPGWPRLALCVYCGKPAHHLDHVFPKSRGGRTTRSNLVPACPDCNRAKGARTPEEWRGED